jgi:hypothetical protein
MRAALPDSRLNPKVGPVSGHAGAARPAPVPPAGYPERWAGDIDANEAGNVR